MELKGIHHVSAITSDAQLNLDFYTKFLGMRLVKKTVNQDDTSVYHLFYGDEHGNPGTELTFFEIPNAQKNITGNSSISTVSLRVANDDALQYWKDRLESYNVEHENIQKQAGRKILPFKDPEGQRLVFVSDEHNKGVAAGIPWNQTEIPQNVGVTGLGPVKLTVHHALSTEAVLTDLLGFRYVGEYPSPVVNQPAIKIYQVGEGGSGAEIHLEHRKDLPLETLGSGGVHHVAFRVENEVELHQWVERIRRGGYANSGFVDRFYFKSLYFREPNGILFEFATDGPGFDTDEHIDHLGESLSLPPFFEDKREQIEAHLKPLNTIL